MLNFPFPYADPTIGAAYYQAAQALADALEARRTQAFRARIVQYVATTAIRIASAPAANDVRRAKPDLADRSAARASAGSGDVSL